MINTALYYPYAEPPAEWLKRSLLLFESVSSIVPDNFGSASPDLAWLAAENVWTPTTALWLDDPTYRDDIETALLLFVDNRRYRFNKSFLAPRNVDRLYIGKLGHEIEHTLSDLQLAKPGHHGFLVVHRDVQTVILAVTAKYLAADANVDPTRRVIPTTDVTLSVDHAFGPQPGSSVLDRCVELGLTGLLPTPGADVSLQDVIRFQEQHTDELHRFRSTVRALTDEVSQSDDPIETIRRYREQVEEATVELGRAARQRRLRLTGGGAAILSAGSAAMATFDPDTVHWVFDGLGTTVGMALLQREVRRTGARSDVGAFSYVYEAQRSFAH